jgi:hypothetical protein
VLCKHEVTGSIPVGSTSSRAGSTIRLEGSRPVSLPVRSRDRGKTDIVKRAKHETFWVRPEWGFGRVPSPRGSGAFGPQAAKRQDNQDSLSKSMTLTEKAASISGSLPLPTCREACRVKSTSVQGGSGLRPNQPRTKGPVCFWIGSSARRAFGGCLGSKRR